MEAWKNKRILITGGTGMVGRALSKKLYQIGCKNISAVGSKECDLRVPHKTLHMFEILQPEYIFHLAAKVYGIGGNEKYKGDILYDNVMINTNVIDSAKRVKVNKIVAMGSGCVYPEINDGRNLKEHQIWMGAPHYSEEAYAHAKRLMLAQLMAYRDQYGMDYVYAISGNLYGKYDKFDIDYGHIIPSLIAKFHTAKKNKTSAVVWGTGSAIRDFMYGDDAAEALIALMDYGQGAVNIGSGNIVSISEIVYLLERITGLTAEWDINKTDGQLERYYDLQKLLSYGFKAKTLLSEGIEKVYNWYDETH